jgi:NAD-dependent DNA ligase
VRIIRSGDVIPHIVEVVEKAVVPGMPDTSYVWNSTNVDILLHDPESDAVVREKNIAGFFRNIGVDGLSIGHTRRIINAVYDTISKIINMEYQDFMKVDGFKERLAEKFSAGIKEKLEEATLAELMHATNIFGRGFGVKRFEAIMVAHPDIVTSQVSRDEMFSKLNTVSGMATKTSQQFLKNLPTFIHWIKSVGLEEKMYTQTKTNTVSKDNPFYGKKYVMTGFRDKSLVDYLSASGAINSSSVSKNTDFVVAKNCDETTGKTKEAIALGVRVISHKDLLKIISQ